MRPLLSGMPEPETPVYQASTTRTRKRRWVGPLPAPRNWETGEERIRTRWDRLKWWLGSLPGFDASVCSDNSVYLFWKGF